MTAGFLVLLALITARLGEDGPSGDPVHGPFRVVDGDTLASGALRLRLLDIDAPEIDQTCSDSAGRSWPCGEAARNALRRLLTQGEAECRGVRQDRYHRLLVDCLVDGQPLAARMVAEGMAVATGFSRFSREESEARNNRRGLWAGAFEYPRDWRRRSAPEEENEAWFWDRMRGLLSTVLP